MKLLNLIIIICMITSCTPRAEKEKYYIPKGFKGQIFIFFNIKNGVEKKYKNGYRIYEIPENGILKTQFYSNYGYQKSGEYLYVYIDSTKKETLLKTYNKSDNLIPNEEVYITAQETGSVGIKNQYQYQTFTVKTTDDKTTLANRNFKLMDSVLRKAELK